MPRVNAQRTIASEETLARRIAYEREKRNMSYAGLAQRMTAIGCPIDQSAIYKIEAEPQDGRRRRRITVDELVAMATVFEIPVANMLQAPEIAIDKKTMQLVEAFDAAVREVTKASDALHEHFDSHGDRASDLVAERIGQRGLTPITRATLASLHRHSEKDEPGGFAVRFDEIEPEAEGGS